TQIAAANCAVSLRNAPGHLCRAANRDACPPAELSMTAEKDEPDGRAEIARILSLVRGRGFYSMDCPIFGRKPMLARCALARGDSLARFLLDLDQLGVDAPKVGDKPL